MSCSPARLEANRRNASRSSGPKTEEGKARSRANAMKHGLAAETLRTPEEAAALQAKGLVDGHLASEVLLLTIRIEKAQDIEDRERTRASMRATLCWDEDRGQNAEQTAKGLAKRPEKVARKLRMTTHGCLWLIERWEWLRDAARNEGGWSEADQALAFHLRGIPLLYRSRPIPPDQQAATVEKEVTALQAQRTKLAPCDAFERESAQCGLSNEATPELRRVIRYEAALHRRLQWCLNPSAKKLPPVPKAAPVPAPAPAAAPSPEPRLKPVMTGVELGRDETDASQDWEKDERFPQGFLAGMDATVPITMIPPGARARVS